MLRSSTLTTTQHRSRQMLSWITLYNKHERKFTVHFFTDLRQNIEMKNIFSKKNTPEKKVCFCIRFFLLLIFIAICNRGISSAIKRKFSFRFPLFLTKISPHLLHFFTITHLFPNIFKFSHNSSGKRHLIPLASSGPIHLWYYKKSSFIKICGASEFHKLSRMGFFFVVFVSFSNGISTFMGEEQ